jgi:amino acid permease
MPGKVLPGRLGRRLPGLGALTQTFINCMVCVVCMISLVSYLIVMYDSAKDLVGDALSRSAVISLAALLMVPLCFLDQRYLSWSSTIAFLVNIYIIGLMISLYAEKSFEKSLPSGACLLGVGKGVIAMLAVLGQCFVIQMCVLPMYQELEDRSPRNFRRCLLIAFGALTLIFGAFAFLGYLTFGPSVEGNALKSLPQTGWARAAQIGTIMVVSALYPIMAIPMVAPVRNMNLGGFYNNCRPEAAARRRKLVTSAAILVIVLVSCVGALSLEKLLVVNVIGGALCVGIFAGLAPGLAGLCLLETRSSAWKFMMLILIVLGVLNAVIGIVFTDNYEEDIASHCAVQVLS